MKINNGFKPTTLKVVARYYEFLHKSSPKAPANWDLNNLDLVTNEAQYRRLISPKKALRTADRGGLVAGVGIGGVLETYAFYARAESVCYVDSNRAITDVIVPVLGLLLMESTSPENFLSTLCSTKIARFDRKAIFSLVPDEYKLNDTLERIGGVISQFTAPEEQAVARTVLNKYLTEFAHCNASSSICGIWPDALFAPPVDGHQFWLGTAEGWHYLKTLWANGSVYGLNTDLAENRQLEMHSAFKQIGRPLSLFYFSNALEWIVGAAKDQAELAVNITAALNNILAVPQQANAMGMFSFLSDLIKGAVVPLSDISGLLERSRGLDAIHLFQLLMGGLGRHYFQPEIERSSYGAFAVEDIYKLSSSADFMRFAYTYSLFNKMLARYMEPEWQGQDLLYYKLNDPGLRPLREQVFARIAELIR